MIITIATNLTEITLTMLLLSTSFPSFSECLHQKIHGWQMLQLHNIPAIMDNHKQRKTKKKTIKKKKTRQN